MVSRYNFATSPGQASDRRAERAEGDAARPNGCASFPEAERGLYVRWRATSQAHIAVKTQRQDFSIFPVRST